MSHLATFPELAQTDVIQSRFDANRLLAPTIARRNRVASQSQIGWQSPTMMAGAVLFPCLQIGNEFLAEVMMVVRCNETFAVAIEDFCSVIQHMLNLQDVLACTDGVSRALAMDVKSLN